MKNLFVCFAFLGLYAQMCVGEISTISKLEYFPKFVTEDDSIKIKYQYTFTSQPCSRDSFNVSVNDSTITINVYYNVGFAASPCGGHDSLTINKLLPNKYNIIVNIIDKANHYADSATISLTVNLGTYLNDLPGEIVDIYPNPVKDKIFYSRLQGKSRISILDANGHTTKTIETNSDKGEIDVSNYGNGVYFIRIDQDGRTINSKVIINK